MGFKIPLEKDVQKTCLEWLALWGATAIRVNSGVMAVEKRRVKFNDQPGCSDVLACLPPDGRMLALELKRPGRDRTDPKRAAEQDSFRRKVVKSGGLAIVARSLDELLAGLKAAGYDVRAAA